MAQKKKATKAKAKATASSANVTRVRAVDTAPVKKASASAKPAKKSEAVAVKSSAKKRKVSAGAALKPVKATGNYFKGAWFELKQVRWPTRRATWGLTGAVLLYSAFFTVVILLLDAGFKYLFELILNK